MTRSIWTAKDIKNKNKEGFYTKPMRSLIKGNQTKVTRSVRRLTYSQNLTQLWTHYLHKKHSTRENAFLVLDK